MCGIAGLIFKDQDVRTDWIVSITNTLKHRGPDDEGYLLVDTLKGLAIACGGDETDRRLSLPHIMSLSKDGYNLALGHRRLSIIDLSPQGHQPMSDTSGSLWIVYNGEIYNYLELREELVSKGFEFKTNTDTEVILNAYKEWGYDCLSKFNGMWAFVIFDMQKRLLFGSRDRFGVKPFYYLHNQNKFCFSSEIKALLKVPHFYPSLNDADVFMYLLLGIEGQEEEGFYKGILELLPSHAFVFDLDNFKFKKWKFYRLEYTDRYEKFDLRKLIDYTANIRTLIYRAVEKRLRSDVPVGSCLSGGLDSSTVVCVINELLKRNNIDSIGDRQKVFTAVYSDDEADESEFAKLVANYTQTDWYRTSPNEDKLLDDLEDLIYVQEIPFGSTSIYAQYRVMKLAKENGIKVLLDGQGGDELFTGYPTFYSTFFLEILCNCDFFSLINEINGLKNSPVNLKSLSLSLLKRIIAKKISSKLLYFFSRYSDKKGQYLNYDFFLSHKENLKFFVDQLPKTLNDHLYQFMSFRNLKTLLKYEDRNSMAFSIESRTPFADDYELIDYVFKIPSIYKIHNGWSKYLLRKTMVGIVPSDILARTDKIGFATPETKWLKNKKEWLITFLKENSKSINEFVRVEKLVNDLECGDDTLYKNSSFIWKVVNITLWRLKFRV